MRIGEVIKATGISRETIHFYIREGLLPAPRKTGKNQAEYGSEHIERLQLIKDLQERFFLPLAAIKNILSEMIKAPDTAPDLLLKSEYFQPLNYLSPGQVVGEKAFLKATGISPRRLADFEEQGVINPRLHRGTKVYSNDDLTIGRIIGDMRQMGLSTEKGFDREELKTIRDQLKEMISQSFGRFVTVAREVFTEAELIRMFKPAGEITAIFCYHMVRRLFREELERRLEVK